MKIVLFSNIRGPDKYFPLNLLSIGTYAQCLGHEVKLIDGQVDREWYSSFLSQSEDADLIGVSSYTGPSIYAVIQVIKSLKDRNLRKPVVWGGYHGTLVTSRLIEEGYADIVVQGYGEKAIEGITNYYLGSGTLEEIPNIVYRSPRGIVTNQLQFITEMDQLPPVNYDLVDVPSYYNETRRIVHYISSYGCPYACTFCAEPIHSQRRWNGFSVERIISDLMRINSRYRPDRVSFVDPNMSTNPRKVVELVGQLIEAGGNIGINCNMRGRDIIMISQLMSVKKLYDAGFRRIFIGVESGSNSQLQKLNKSSTAENHLQAVTMLDDVGIEVQASFIHDLPNETEEEAVETIDLARKLINVRTQGSNQSHHFFMPYPGTELASLLSGEMDLSIESVTQEEWARTSTFQASKVWRGNESRRHWVIKELAKLHRINSDVITTKEIERLEENVRMEHDYVEKFLL